MTSPKRKLPNIKLPNIKQRLAQLIGHVSVSSTQTALDMSNREMIDQLADWLDTLGFHIEIMPLPDAPHKANLIATLGSGPGGLVLAGHTDTVPYDETRWSVPPLTLSEQHDRFYGLGTADMKSFFSLAIEAIQSLLEQPLKHPLIILASADEESSMAGARALSAADLSQARYALVGEPTNMRPIHMHKGIMMESVQIIGRSAHSSDPSLGNNALDAMHQAMTALMALRQSLAQTYQQPAFAIATPTLNLGCIHGGDNPNRICGYCELHFDLRLLPGMNPDALREQIQSLLDRVATQTGTQIKLQPLMPSVPAYQEARTSTLLQTVEKLTNHVSSSVAFTTEAPFLQALGMQTLVLGPGRIEQAHQPDEYLATEQIQPMVKLLQQLIQHFCL